MTVGAGFGFFAATGVEVEVMDGSSHGGDGTTRGRVPEWRQRRELARDTGRFRVAAMAHPILNLRLRRLSPRRPWIAS